MKMWWEIINRDVFPDATIWHDVFGWFLFIGLLLLVVCWLKVVYDYQKGCNYGDR